MPERDPLTGYHFMLEIDGITQAFFREASGFSSENPAIDYKDARATGQTRYVKVPGTLKWSDVTLKRGITDVLELWKWRKQVEDGKVEQARKNGSIVMFNQANTEVARWNFVNAWPSKIDGPTANANTNDIAVEAITIVHEGLERVR